MAPSVDQLVKQAYQMIDEQPDYTIPRLARWRKTHKIGAEKKICACIGCGTPIVHNQEKDILRCAPCREKLSGLWKKRKSNFCKNPIIETHL